jgi:hypothetical protein
MRRLPLSARAGPWLALLAVAAACSDQPTQPPASPPQSVRQAAAPGPTVILPQDLGVLPGSAESWATSITEGGVVYGYSAGELGDIYYFSWTQASGMTRLPYFPPPPQPPFALPTIPPYASATAVATNAKGEATGYLCWANCADLDGEAFAHALRFSPGAGTVPVDTRHEAGGAQPVGASRGWGINRWGHVVGAYMPPDDVVPGDAVHFFWTPIDSFTVLDPSLHPGEDTEIDVNDLDQVIGKNYAPASGVDACSFVWRPDLGLRRLASTADGQCATADVRPRVHAQQRSGTLAVGAMWVTERETDDEGNVVERGTAHAALWRIPPVDRSGFPSVNANPYGGAGSTIRLSNGGRYYQLYRGTQATAIGPYTELVDWGDGTTSRRTRSAVNILTSQNHLYTKTGTYWVRVYVQDAQQRWGVDERKLTVAP